MHPWPGSSNSPFAADLKHSRQSRDITQLAPPRPSSPRPSFVAVTPVDPVVAAPSSSRPITDSNWLQSASTDENSLPIYMSRSDETTIRRGSLSERKPGKTRALTSIIPSRLRFNALICTRTCSSDCSFTQPRIRMDHSCGIVKLGRAHRILERDIDTRRDYIASYLADLAYERGASLLELAGW